jgi:hypothetical protein
MTVPRVSAAPNWQLNSLTDYATKDAVVAEIRDRLANLEYKIEEKEEKGVKEKDGLKIIRFDLCLASNVSIDAPKELWMDHAIVQETASSSYQDDMVEHLESGGQTSRSPAFRRIEQMKERKYRPLL